MGGGSSVSSGSLTPNRRKLKKREPFYRISKSSWLRSRAFGVCGGLFESTVKPSDILVKRLIDWVAINPKLM